MFAMKDICLQKLNHTKLCATWNALSIYKFDICEKQSFTNVVGIKFSTDIDILE